MIDHLPLRIQEKIHDTGDCWLWTGALRGGGYPGVRWQGRLVGAHHVVYELIHGALPDGLELDHLCRVRRCVRPDHLEAVTRSENHRRIPLRTHCRNGHLLQGHNLYLDPGGGRRCRTCRNAYQAEWRRGQHQRAEGLAN